MNYSTYSFTLDLQVTQAQVSIPVKFGDTARSLNITLTDGGRPFALSEGCRAVLSARKADGTTLFNNCIIDLINATIRYNFTENTANSEGLTECEIIIYGTKGTVVGSPRFIMIVDKRVIYDGDIVSQSEKESIDAMISAEINRDTAEGLRKSAEENRQSNETVREEAEGNRVNAETKRVAEEKTRQSNETARVEAETNRANAFNKYKDIISNALKGNKQGQVLALSDASPIEHELAVKVKSKNLIPYPHLSTTTTVGKTTFTDNGDGTWTLSGETSSGTDVIINRFILPKGTYTLSGVTGSAYHRIYVYDGEQYYYQENYASPTTFTLNNKTEVTVGIKTHYPNYAINNAPTYKPQIEVGTTATSYTPFIDVSTIPIKVYKQKKNLIPYPYATESGYTVNGLTFTVNEDKSITVSGVATAATRFLLGTAVLGDKACTATDTEKTNNLIVASKRIQYLTNQTINLFVAKGTDYTVPETFYPQIEVGTVLTEYEPPESALEYTASSDGTVEGITSVYPTTLTSDTTGVIVTAEYNRDLNKAFEELYNVIISLGGNV